ncbi:MAG: O-antigen ligase family protein [Bacteroidales bacterium]|nr:O-antigen ligase family protein [Bacteroidales bacterium]
MLLLIENFEIQKQKTIDHLYLIFKITIVVAFLFSCIQLFYDPFFFTPETIQERYFNRISYNIRLSSIFGWIGRNETGMSFLPLLSLVICDSIIRKDKWLYLWIILGGLVAFSSNSRWIQLNFLIICSLLIVYRKVSLAMYLIILGSAIVIFVTILYLGGTNIIEYIQLRLLANTAESRYLAFDMFARFFKENPMFGTGIHVTNELRLALLGRSSQIHIGYLSHLYEFGIVGSVILFSFWFSVIRKFYFSARRTNFYGIFFAFLSFLLANLTLVSYSFFSYGIFMAFLLDKYYSEGDTKNMTELKTNGIHIQHA